MATDRPALAALGVGELVMGSVNQWLLARTLRSGAASPEAWTDARIAAVWEQFDQGTQRAILRLHRSIDPAGLAAAGADLEQLWMPALVVWGERDPWLAPASPTRTGGACPARRWSTSPTPATGRGSTSRRSSIASGVHSGSLPASG